MFWKIYFYFFIIVNIAAYTAFVFIGEYVPILELETISDAVGIISTPIGILGLYGLVKNKKLLFQSFWIGFFFILILNEVLYGSYSFFEIISGYEMNLQSISLIAGAVILLFPYYIGIYIYSVKKDFWYEKNT